MNKAYGRLIRPVSILKHWKSGPRRSHVTDIDIHKDLHSQELRLFVRGFKTLSSSGADDVPTGLRKSLFHAVRSFLQLLYIRRTGDIAPGRTYLGSLREFKNLVKITVDFDMFIGDLVEEDHHIHSLAENLPASTKELSLLDRSGEDVKSYCFALELFAGVIEAGAECLHNFKTYRNPKKPFAKVDHVVLF